MNCAAPAADVISAELTIFFCRCRQTMASSVGHPLEVCPLAGLPADIAKSKSWAKIFLWSSFLFFFCFSLQGQLTACQVQRPLLLLLQLPPPLTVIIVTINRLKAQLCFIKHMEIKNWQNWNWNEKSAHSPTCQLWKRRAGNKNLDDARWSGEKCRPALSCCWCTKRERESRNWRVCFNKLIWLYYRY